MIYDDSQLSQDYCEQECHRILFTVLIAVTLSVN